MTVIIMKALQEFFKKEKENSKRKIIGEKPYQKIDSIRYWTKTFSDGTIECWAIPSASLYKGQKIVSNMLLEQVYLGMCKNGDVIKSDDFHDLKFRIQEQALKLFSKAGFYD